MENWHCSETVNSFVLKVRVHIKGRKQNQPKEDVCLNSHETLDSFAFNGGLNTIKKEPRRSVYNFVHHIQSRSMLKTINMVFASLRF